MRVLHERERVESRALAALRCVDAASGSDVEGPLDLRALDGVATFRRNRSGLYVIVAWSALALHRDAFDAPPVAPDVGRLTLSIAVDDPSGRYLPRRVDVALPRHPDPANAASIFRPVEVSVYPAASAPTGTNWSLVRVHVTERASGDVLGGVLLRVRRNGDVIARGLTDGRGEALVAVVGVPVLTFGEHDDDAVVVEQVDVTLEAVFDPAAGSRARTAALGAGHVPPRPAVDPAALEAHAGTLPHVTQALSIAARRSQTVSLELALP